MIQRPHKENSQALYERNYRMLLGLFPQILSVEKGCVSCDLADVMLGFEIIEQTPYTTALNIVFEPKLGEIFKASTTSVRLYHDAKVAEVISYQGHRYLRPHYEFPNAKMYYKDEKRQINRLLQEMLLFLERIENPEFASFKQVVTG